MQLTQIGSVIISALMTVIIFLILVLGFKRNSLCKFIAINIDELITNMAVSTGSIQWKYLFLPIFYFICINNVLGCLGFFALNSLIITPLLLAVVVTISGIFIGLYKKNIRMLLDLVPHETPILIKPLIFVIEIISIAVKPLTLFIRLFLNVVIGHYIIHVLHSLLSNTTMLEFFIALPIVTPVFLLLNVMEIGTSLLQAFIFINFSSLLISNLTEKH